MEETLWEGIFLLLLPRVVGLPGQDVGALVGGLPLPLRRGVAKEESGQLGEWEKFWFRRGNHPNLADMAGAPEGCRKCPVLHCAVWLPLSSNLFLQDGVSQADTFLDFWGWALAT